MLNIFDGGGCGAEVVEVFVASRFEDVLYPDECSNVNAGSCEEGNDGALIEPNSPLPADEEPVVGCWILP